MVRLRVPPLRERPEDVPLLFGHFLQEAADRQCIAPKAVSDEVMRHLHAHDWPGNVRELRHFASSIALGIDLARIEAPADGHGQSLYERVQSFEAAVIRQSLQQSGGDIAQAVGRLRIPRKTLYDKLSRYKISPPAFRAVKRTR